jgi:hypothetical protein
MTSKNSQGDYEDNRSQWERPTLRILATEFAEGGGPTQDEGNCTLGGKHSQKNAICP